VKNLNLNTILLVGIAVLVTLQLKSCFEPSRVDPKVIESKIRQEYYEKELPLIRQERDAIYAKYDSLLSASAQRYNNLEQRKIPINNAIKQVPVIVGNLDKEHFSRALSEYYEKYK